MTKNNEKPQNKPKFFCHKCGRTWIEQIKELKDHITNVRCGVCNRKMYKVIDK